MNDEKKKVMNNIEELTLKLIKVLKNQHGDTVLLSVFLMQSATIPSYQVEI